MLLHKSFRHHERGQNYTSDEEVLRTVAIKEKEKDKESGSESESQSESWKARHLVNLVPSQRFGSAQKKS